MIVTAKNASGEYDSVQIDKYFKVKSGKKVVDNGAGKLETIKAGKSTVKYTAATLNKNINAIRSSVASWLTTNDYSSTAAVFASGNKEDIASLIAAYTPNNNQG